MSFVKRGMCLQKPEISMNIFFYELRKRWIGVIVWSVVIFLFMLLSMTKFGSFTNDPQAVEALMKQLPETLLAVFGMSGLDVGTITGYYGVNFIFLALMLSVHAGLLGVDIIAREEQAQTAEFLYTKPVRRASVLAQKIISAHIIVALIALATMAATYFSMSQYASFDDFAKEFWLFSIALLIIQLVSLWVGLLAAVTVKDAKKSPVRISQFILVSYFVFVFVKLIPSLWWGKYVSIFAMFEAKDIIDSLSLNPVYVLMCCLAIVSAAVLTFMLFKRRDIQA